MSFLPKALLYAFLGNDGNTLFILSYDINFIEEVQFYGNGGCHTAYRSSKISVYAISHLIHGSNIRLKQKITFFLQEFYK